MNVNSGHGLLDQINTVNTRAYTFAEQKPFTIIEVGDYSMIVKETYETYKISDIRGIEVTESIESPEGTILYFSSKLPEGIKYYNVVYANVERVFTTDWVREMIKSQFEASNLSTMIDKIKKKINNNEQSK